MATQAAEYRDGTYEGSSSFVNVKVTIEDGNISDVTILGHGGGGKPYADLVAPLTKEIVEKQSTSVDAVTGATVSSDALKQAVKKALEKAAVSSE